MAGERRVQRMGMALFGLLLVAVCALAAYVLSSARMVPGWLEGWRADTPAVAPSTPRAATPHIAPSTVTTPAPAPAAPPAPEPAPAQAAAPATLPVLIPVEPEHEPEPPEDPEDVLLDAVDRGDLRLGTYGDVTRWHARHRARVPGAAAALPDHFEHMEVYLVQRAFRIPPGLSGAHAVVFVVQEGAPLPKGDPGHSPVLDMASGACRGAICMLLRED